MCYNEVRLISFYRGAIFVLEIAIEILKKLEDSNYKAYIVGGFVRDTILKIKSNDIDITTNAKPKEIKEVFSGYDVNLSAAIYGSVILNYKNVKFEITTFRKETKYLDNRHPAEIEYIDDLYQDLLRRDFTINTICMTSEEEIIDFLKGQDDIKRHLINCVGDANKKMSEDALRIIRAIRYATKLDFNISRDVEEAIRKNKKKIRTLSYNRIKEELDKMFTCPNALKGIELIEKYKLAKELGFSDLDKAKKTHSLIGIWAVVDKDLKYPYTNNERTLIENIRKVMERDNLDPYVLYKYGLYVNQIAGEIKELDTKKITEVYNDLPIKSRREIAINATEIIDIMGNDGMLTEIYHDLEKEILLNNLENKEESLAKYIKDNYR